jgi:two-component system LytT family sensor kinase
LNPGGPWYQGSMPPTLQASDGEAPGPGARADLRAAVLLTAGIWAAQLSVIVASTLPMGASGAPVFQLARLLVAVVGALICLGIHLATPPPRGPGAILARLALCPPAAALLTLYSHVQFGWLAPAGTPYKPLLADFAFSFGYYLWIFLAWAAALIGFQALRQAEAQRRRLARIEADAHQAQLMALRQQISPHFFFNVLNTLSGLIGTRRLAEAEQVILGMADVLRYSLKGEPGDTVSLSDEVRAQRTYLDIETIRFGERLQIAIDIPAEAQAALVPALILQPLVENAVKHGVGRSETPIRVALGAARDGETLVCWVENDVGQAPAGQAENLGLGLSNVSRRLSALYGPAAGLEAGPTANGGWRSEARLPFVTGAAG